MNKDQQLRLLMNLLNFKEIKEYESSEDENNNDLVEKNVWIIPKEYTRFKLLETNDLIIRYENEPIDILNKKSASKLIKKVKKRGQRKRVVQNKDKNNKGKTDVIITDLSAPYILDEKDNASEEESDDEAFNAFLKREAELRQKTSEKHDRLIEEENEKRSQALLKREKIMKNIESRIKNKKKRKSERGRKSIESIEINDDENNIEENTNNDTTQQNISESPKTTRRRRLIKRNEILTIPDEDDDYDNDNNNDNNNVDNDKDNNNNNNNNPAQIPSSLNSNQNIGIAFESDTDSDSESDSNFIFKANTLNSSFVNEEEKDMPIPSFTPFKTNTVADKENFGPNENTLETNTFKRKIDESQDMKDLGNDMENIHLNNKKRRKMLIIESDSENE